MQFKSKRGLALLMGSVMAATLIFANTVKATETETETPVTSPNTTVSLESKKLPKIVTNWNFMNEDGTKELAHITTDPNLKYNDGTSKEYMSCDSNGECHITLYGLIGEDGAECRLALNDIYFQDKYGRVVAHYPNNSPTIRVTDQGGKDLNIDHLDPNVPIPYDPDNPIKELNIYINKGHDEGNADYMAAKYYKKDLNNEGQPAPEINKIEVKIDEPIHKEDKDELLRNKLKEQFQVVFLQEPAGKDTQYFLFYAGELGSYVKIAQNNVKQQNSNNFHIIDLFGNLGDNKNRIKLFLYNEEKDEYVKVDGKTRLNLLDPGAFSKVKPGNYKLVLDTTFENHGGPATNGNQSLRSRYEFKNNMVFDINFNFTEAEEPVTYTEPTMPMAHNIHVTLHDGDKEITRIPIIAGSKLPESMVPTPVKEGYEFLGWYYKASDEYKLGPRGLEDELLQFNFDRSIYTDFDLYAKWEKKEEKRPVPKTADCN